MLFSPEANCYMGDDVQDIQYCGGVGFPVAVANAYPEAKQVAAYVSYNPGGGGAIREVVELILHSQNKWTKAIAEFFE